MDKRLMIMRPVTTALLQGGIEPETLVLLNQVLFKYHPLIETTLRGHLLEVIVRVVIRIIARTPLEFELAKVIAEMLHVVPNATRLVGIA